MTFDEVIPAVVRICEGHPAFGGVTRACVVRDLEGRVRLVLDAGNAGVDAKVLEAALSAELAPWFQLPLLGRGLAHAGRLAREATKLTATILDKGEEWKEAGWRDVGSGEWRAPAQGRWFRLERRLSKADWATRRRSAAPWPLVARKPKIVTFFSFKGGVGRTTLLASVAWQLAKLGRRVLAIDLDVEAPGLASLLGADPPRGLVDFLVDHLATGQGDLPSLRRPATALGDEAPLVEVVGAGRLDAGYFEKLARLDFVGSGLLDDPDGSPVQRGLRALMDGIAGSEPCPDYILLDSRAGLHDVAGLSLHDLAHVDVLVGRDSEQSYRGLELTIEALGRRRSSRDQRFVVVQAMAPGDRGSEEFERVTGDFRHRVWEAFSKHVYEQEEAPGGEEETGADLENRSAPSEESETAGHYPWVIRYNERLVRFTALADVRAELFDQDFTSVLDRIEALSAPEATDQTAPPGVNQE